MKTLCTVTRYLVALAIAACIVPAATTSALAATLAAARSSSHGAVPSQSARLAFATYLGYHGGAGDDYALGVKVDAAGYIYVVGTTASGLSHPSIFVTKLEPSGKKALYTTLLNSGCESDAAGIALDRAGNAYVTGSYVVKDSTGLCDLTEVVVAKLGAAGKPLYSVQFGGKGGFEAKDAGNGIAVDAQGNAYVTGQVNSDDTFPTTAAAFMKTGPGFVHTDGFVLKVDAAGKLVYSTILGGTDLDNAQAIAVDGHGDAYVTGQTSSTDFPTTANAYERQWARPRGLAAAFVTVLNAAGTSLLYSSYLSGNSAEQGLAIAVSQQGNGYVAGATDSSNFPTTASAFSRTCGGDAHCGLSVSDQGGCLNGCKAFDDSFVAEIDPRLSGKVSLVYGTYLGGTLTDQALGIAVDASHHVYVTGGTSSTNFPTDGAIQGAHADAANPLNPNLDCFVAELTPSKPGSAGLLFATFLGGKGDDYGRAIALGHAGAVYVVGTTNSTDFPASSALQARSGGAHDAVAVRINLTP
jgi:Beta-propeller repeat